MNKCSVEDRASNTGDPRCENDIQHCTNKGRMHGVTVHNSGPPGDCARG